MYFKAMRRGNNLIGEEIVVLEVEAESKPGIIQVQGNCYVGQVLQHGLVVLLDQPHQGLLVAVLEHVQPELGDALRVRGEVRVEAKLLHLLGKNNLLKDRVGRSTELDHTTHLSIFLILFLVARVLHLRTARLVRPIDNLKGRITLTIQASHLLSFLVDLVILGLVLQVELVHLTVVLSFGLEREKKTKFFLR